MALKHKYLAIGAIILGLGALVIGDKPQSSLANIAMSFAEFDEVVQSPIETISVIELAEYLQAQNHHYNLVALQERPSKHDVSSSIKPSLNSYIIPTAEVHSISSFLAKEIPVNETIFLYSEHETKSIQLYYLLLIRGYFKVKVVEGGLNQWQRDVLWPTESNIPAAQLNHRKQLTTFFGGKFASTQTKLLPIDIILDKKKKEHHGC